MEQTIREQQAAALARTGGYYKHICWMALPLVCMSAYLYGPRPVLLCLVALLTGNLCDRLVALLRRRVYRSGDWSNESFALVIALLMPATVSWYVLVVAVLAGVLLGKEAFGGYRAATAAIPSTRRRWAMWWWRCPGRSRSFSTRSPTPRSPCGTPRGSAWSAG